MLVIGVGLFSLAASPTFANTIQLGINGDVLVGSNFLNFGQYPNGAPFTPAPGYGTFSVSLVSSGMFANYGGRWNHFGLCQLSPADLLHSLKLQVARTFSVLSSG
jgi:hypothetical protein